MIEPTLGDLDHLGPPPDAHGMDPVMVLGLAQALGGTLPRVLVVGCEPQTVMRGDEEDVGAAVSEPVRAAAHGGGAGPGGARRGRAPGRVAARGPDERRTTEGGHAVSDVKITPTAQLAILGALLAAIIAIVAAEAPEIRRYLSIRSM